MSSPYSPGMNERTIRAMLRGDYGSVALPHPISGPSVYARVAKLALAEHDLDPLSDPEALAIAEGLEVVYAPMPAGVATRFGNTIMMRWVDDPRERGWRITHERAHAHLDRYGHPRSNETDAWFVTVALAIPVFCRDRADFADFAPEWLPRILLAKRAA
jgi:hypothetical protein